MGIRIAIGLVLTVLACSEARAQCTVSADCDDNNVCTIDVCTFLGCVHRPINCNDNNVCTTDICDPILGCQHAAGALNCNDNNVCTTDTCDPVVGCTHTGGAFGCNDNNVCTIDTCDPIAGCQHTGGALNCDDNNACTIDVCDSVTGCRHLLNIRCTIVQNLSVKSANSLASFSFKRSGGSKGGVDFVKVTLQDVVLNSIAGKLVHQKVKVNAEITGADADVGSLLYPVAALGLGSGALPAVQGLGLDVAAIGELQPCQAQLPGDVCRALALQLSKAIDASLGPGDDTPRKQFHDAAEVLGFASDACCVPTTCAAQSANCGSIPDGCGGMLDCGTCTPPASCGGAGVPNQCGVLL